MMTKTEKALEEICLTAVRDLRSQGIEPSEDGVLEYMKQHHTEEVHECAVSEALKRILQHLAKHHGLTLSEFIMKIVHQYVFDLGISGLHRSCFGQDGEEIAIETRRADAEQSLSAFRRHRITQACIRIMHRMWDERECLKRGRA